MSQLEGLIVLEQIYADDMKDVGLLIKKLGAMLKKIHRDKERLIILVCDEERQILKGERL